MFKKKFKKNKKAPLYKSFYYAFCGIKEGLFEERNMFIHFLFMIAVIICGIIFKINKSEWIACLILFALVMALELVKTAIENTIDICCPNINPKAKIAKDTAAGAVLIAAIFAATIGLIIFIPKFINLIL